MVDTIFCLVSCGGGGRPGDGGSTYSDDDCLLCSLSPTPSPSLFLPRKRRRGEERECGRKPSWLRLRVGGGRRGREGGWLSPFLPLPLFRSPLPPWEKRGSWEKGRGEEARSCYYVPPSCAIKRRGSGGRDSTTTALIGGDTGWRGDNGVVEKEKRGRGENGGVPVKHKLRSWFLST